VSTSHAQAAAILASAWGEVHRAAPVGQQIPYAQAVAWLETHYGQAGQFAGSNNWGAIHSGHAPPCPPGTFLGTDLGPVCFTAYADPVAGAVGFLRVLTTGRRTVVANAMVAGTPEDVASAMKATAYFQATAESYAQAIRGALAVIGAHVVPTPAPATPVGFGGALATAAAIALVLHGRWMT
jgi:hypothetical protein